MNRLGGLLLLLVLLFPGSGLAEDKAALLQKASEALDRSDRKRADFYIARWMGLCEREGKAACDPRQLEPVLKKRRLEPRGFLPGEWDPGFVEWFETGIRSRWGVDAERIREKARSFEIAHETWENRYFVTVVAYPEMELWHALKEGIVSRPLVLPMAGYRDRVTLYFGRLIKGSRTQVRPFFLDTKKRVLHQLWKPQFHDVDGDKAPELWLRFNIAWGNGFMQVLDVYRVHEDKELALVKRFEGANGHARRLPDGSVEVARTKPLAVQTQEVESWIYKEGEFQKTSQKEVPSALDGPGWSKIYLQ